MEEDFSFVVGGGAPSCPPQQQQQQQRAGTGAPRPAFQIPTYLEVQQQQQPTGGLNLFRPKGLVASVTGQHAATGAGAPSTSGAQQLQQQHGALEAGAHKRTWNSMQGPGMGPMQPTAPSTAAPPSAHAPNPQQHQGPSPYHAAPGPHTGAPPTRPDAAVRPAYAPPQFGNLPAAAAAAPPGQQVAGGGPLPSNAIIVNRRQQGNPVLKHIRNVRWQFGDIVPDYQLGQSTGALFLSLRYHLLHPEYILARIKEQQRLFRLSVLLLHVDVEDVVKALGEITRATVVSDMTLVCAWSAEECARWLETYKSYESKPASSIQERVEHDYLSRLTSVLTNVRGVNRTDAHALGTKFGSLAAIMRGSAEEFSACPGVGAVKVRRLLEAFNEPFRRTLRAPGPAQQQEGQPSRGPGGSGNEAASVPSPVPVAAPQAHVHGSAAELSEAEILATQVAAFPQELPLGDDDIGSEDLLGDL